MAGSKTSDDRPRGKPRRETVSRQDDGADSRNLVNSLAKGFRVLEAFTAETPHMTLSEVARAADIDPGTAFRMLNTLVMLGYVARIPEAKRFRLTPKVVDLGLKAIGRSDLREVARPILRSLVGEASEAASLGVLDDADILYVERVRAGLTRLDVDIRIGTRVPAGGSVIGMAILAHLAPAERTIVLSKSLDRAGPRVSQLKRALAEIKAQGFAWQVSPFGNGLRILAAPVLDADGRAIAAVSVAAPPVTGSGDAFRTRALGPLRAAAHDIGLALQASGTIAVAI